MIKLKVISPSFEVIDKIDGDAILQKIEAAGRTCYKSESLITPESARKFVANVIKRGHESVIEHVSISVRVICDRGVSHEIVRHRLASYSQESTRYCNYSAEKFGNELTFIKPPFFKEKTPNYFRWECMMRTIERTYLSMVENGATAQEARTVLPNSLKTEIVMTMNLREWRHFFRMRADVAHAHPQMCEIAVPMLKYFREKIPVVFDDIYPELS